MAYFKVIAGPMFSGKTEELIRVLRRSEIAGKRVLVIKPDLDTRSSAEIVSRHQPDLNKREFTKSSSFDAVPISSASHLLSIMQTNFPTVIGIDEAQFFGVWLPGFLEDLLKQNADGDLTIIAAGLDRDAWRRPFGIMPELLSMADEVQKETAICFVCKSPAQYTQKLGGSGSQVEVGDAEIYEARCRTCHILPDLDQKRIF